MLISTVIGRLWGEPEERLTTTGKSLTTLTLSFQDRDRSYKYIRLCLWGDKFNKVIPLLKNGTTVFVQGSLLIDSYLSRAKGEIVVSLTINVDTLQVIFTPFTAKKEETEKIEKKEPEEAHFASEEENQEDKTSQDKKDEKVEEDEDWDWGFK